MGTKKITLADYLRIVGPTYRSIDLRVAAFRENTGWTSMLLLCRMCYEEPEVIRQSQKTFLGQSSNRQTKHFAIIGRTYSYGSLGKLNQELKQGVLQIERKRLQFTKQLNLTDLEGEFPSPTYGYFGDRPWPGVLEIHDQVQPTLPQNLQLIDAEVSERGFPSGFSQFVSYWLEGNFAATSLNMSTVVLAPLFAKLSSVSLDGNQLNIAVDFHERLRRFRVTIGVWPEWTPSKRPRFAPIEREIKGGQLMQAPFRRWSESIPLPQLNQNDNVFVTLYFAPLKGCEVDREHITVQRERDRKPSLDHPLLHALRLFCPDQDVESWLLTPKTPGGRLVGKQLHPFKKQLDKPQFTFELGVYTLLTLAGLTTVPLGLTVKETLLAGASADLAIDALAYDPVNNRILLCRCTTKADPSGEIDPLFSVREAVRESFRGSNTLVDAALFASVQYAPQAKSQGTRNGIFVFTGNNLESLLESIRDWRGTGVGIDEYSGRLEYFVHQLSRLASEPR